MSIQSTSVNYDAYKKVIRRIIPFPNLVKVDETTALASKDYLNFTLANPTLAKFRCGGGGYYTSEVINRVFVDKSTKIQIKVSSVKLDNKKNLGQFCSDYPLGFEIQYPCSTNKIERFIVHYPNTFEAFNCLPDNQYLTQKELITLITNKVFASYNSINLTNVNLEAVDLTEANLRCVDLCEANLRHANLSKANLFWANLWGANLSGANFEGATLIATILKKATFDKPSLTTAAIVDSCVF
jgi:hypothetical protein